MPQKSIANRKEASKRAEKRFSQIAQRIYEQAKGSGLSRNDIERLLKEVLHDPHIAGIKKVVPQISFDASGRDSKGKEFAIFKVSITTTKTRKKFAIRK